MALKFIGADGTGEMDDAIQAIHYAADNGAKIASNSWGCVCQSQLLEDALTYAYNRGVILVAAAGNYNSDVSTFSPASSSKVITVGASDQDGNKANFSNWGDKIDVVAPGVNILSARASGGTMCPLSSSVNSKYCQVSGTSMATPHVAGLAALLVSAHGNLSPEEVRQILRQAATDYAPAGRDSNFGYGQVEAARTIARQVAPSYVAPVVQSQPARPVPPPPPPPPPPQPPITPAAPARQLRPLSKKDQRTKVLLQSRLRTAERKVSQLQHSQSSLIARLSKLQSQQVTASGYRAKSLARQIRSQQNSISRLEKQINSAQNGVNNAQSQLDRLLYY